MKYLKQEKKKSKLPLIIGIFAICLVCFFILFTKPKEDEVSLSEIDSQTEQKSTLPTETNPSESLSAMPWDEPGAKQPVDYTWQEYEALTGAQQKVFKAHLGVDAYSKWLDSMRTAADVKPWNEVGAKQPEEYSWEEYEALSTTHQIAFQNYLGVDAFSVWLTGVQREATPWDEADAKNPEDYTWEEFEALTAAQQMLFQYDLGAEGFDNWLNQAQDQSEPAPWDEAGAKQPADYTWQEFEALTGTQQMAFQNYLGAEAFEAWLNSAQNTTTKANPWEISGAKQPENYTWQEFEALTAAQQMAFQNYLGAEAFETWLDSAQNTTEANPWDKTGAKQPADYTWQEFEALTGPQQMAFQNYLGSDVFEAWLNRNANQ